MSENPIDTILEQSQRLTPSERLWLAMRLIEEVRQSGLVETEPGEGARHALRDNLARLAKLKAFSEIPDAAAWQRDQRVDRSLPGREV